MLNSHRLQGNSRPRIAGPAAPAAAAAAAAQQRRLVTCSAKQQRRRMEEQPRRRTDEQPRRRSEEPLLKEDFEVPAVGWMWDPNTAAATKSSLKSANIKAKKSLGQNFCTDDQILADIVTAARVAPSDVVIEVGPGTGNLTRHLLATRARVLAVEKDDTLIERLREEFKQVPNLQLVHGDVMRLDLRALVAQMAAAAAAAAQLDSQASSNEPQQEQQQQQQQLQQPPPPEQQQQPADESSSSISSSRSSSSAAPGKQRRRGVKVVANLPYNITKEFLQAMLPQGGVVSELSIMIQEEVAQRLVDPTPSRPDYRAMSLITHYYSKPVYRFLIPKEKYFPVPGVDGALVTFKLLPPSKRVQVSGERGFISLINKAFSERRKMMRNTLQPLYTPQQVEAALQKAGVRPDARAQDLDVEQFAAVYNNLQAEQIAAVSAVQQ